MFTQESYFLLTKVWYKLRKHGKLSNCENEEDINHNYKVFWIPLPQCEFQQLKVHYFLYFLGSMESRAEVNDYTEANTMFFTKITLYGVKEIITQVRSNIAYLTKLLNYTFIILEFYLA